MDTVVRLFFHPIIRKEPMTYCKLSSFAKKIFFKREEFGPQKAFFLPCGVEAYCQRRHTVFDRVTSATNVSLPLIGMV